MRLLTELEITRASSLSRLDIPLAFLEVTATGLGKSILDATEPVRKFLLENGFHNYSSQPQGPEAKQLKHTNLARPDGSVDRTSTSLYRPTTKQGDPRLWTRGLKTVADPGDIVAYAAIQGELWAINLTKVPVDELAYRSGPISEALAIPFAEKTFVVDELTQALIELNRKGFILAPGVGDTMVGRVLESALGIVANSRKAPDYKGIELKAFRVRAGRAGAPATHAMKRRNLFAKTPNWALSSLKSSRAIVDTFGYDRDGERRLYCEVRGGRTNTQGLSFAVDNNSRLLREQSDRLDVPEVVAWELDVLESELAAKHRETFWIGAEARKEGVQESFRYVMVEHTQQPLVEQFGPLVTAGHISMDHLIKRKGAGAQEKGPLFKVDNAAAELLFPSPRNFSLLPMTGG